MRLYGKNPVIERLRANPKSIRKIYLQQGFKGVAYVQKKATQWNIPVFVVPPTKLLKMARDKNAQGVVLEVDGFEYSEYGDLLDQALKNKRCPVFFDGITDPQNLGAIVRSMACLGKFSIILPSHDSVSMTETVLRVSSGGDNYVPVAVVPNINKAMQKAQGMGFSVAGAVVEGGEELQNVDLKRPIALVVGSEQKGIRDIVQKNLDIKVTIPMSVKTLSFNVAQATTILCYEVNRQNQK
jgi:23S rRNA (guanosine2251-2'-O)-methyltransferase